LKGDVLPLDFEQIRRQVTDAGGIKCFRMQVLRDASPYKRLGPGVNGEISAALDQKGLGHTKPLPLYHLETVYVFEVGSQAARLINAVTGTPSEDGAKAILQAVTPDVQGNEAVRKLDEIKALLVQMQDVFREQDGGERLAA
jgi:hypothetical protein